MSNAIVQVQVTQTIAPAASLLQKTGALISQGATNTSPGTLSLLTQLSDLTAILNGSKTISTITWAANVATVTAASPHGFTVNDTIWLTIAGATPSGYNGTYLCTVTSSTAFTFALTPNPGTITIPGSYTIEDVAELNSMATTFFAQGNLQSVYVLELGPGSPADGVSYLTTYLTSNPHTIYSMLVPRTWAAEATFLTLVASYESTTAMTYFYVTATISGSGAYTNFTSLMKCCKVMVEAPSIGAAEFSHAADFQHDLNYAPSTTNRVTPNAFAYLFGVTPYPTVGNNVLFTNLKAAGVNWVGTGAEGGISNTILMWGTTMDGRDFTYWYSVDWAQINLNLDLSNEIINGSNNPLAPLYYTQNGINRLQARAQGTLNRGVSFGMILATSPVAATSTTPAQPAGPVVTAVPFATYVQQNPSDYKTGTYNGLSAVLTPARGFTSILFNLNVTDFPAG